MHQRILQNLKYQLKLYICKMLSWNGVNRSVQIVGSSVPNDTTWHCCRP